MNIDILCAEHYPEGPRSQKLQLNLVNWHGFILAITHPEDPHGHYLNFNVLTNIFSMDSGHR
jgi:hypothetical protein